ncbi:hypothetical protein LBMAG21_07090 [Armatimonadota bacterium]|nr:hypothetical protein LBMAG21_07090 [Armatimonadota bacterium]
MRNRKTGFILVEALIVVACLVALMAMLAANQHSSMRETQDRLRQKRAESAARSAVAYVFSTLTSATPNSVTLNDNWAQLGGNGNQSFELGDLTFRVQIIDANSRLNVNVATAPQLQSLLVDQTMVDSLLDWRETSTTPRANGAKDEYYTGLETPYIAKLASLTTLEELLLIKGWTAQKLFTVQTDVIQSAITQTDTNNRQLPLIDYLTVDGGAPNTRANGSTKINLGVRGVTLNQIVQLGLTQAQATQVFNRIPFNSFQQLLGVPGLTPIAQQRLLDAVTFTAGNRVTGKINLNTAPSWVLQTIPNVTLDIANTIVTQQSTGFTGLSQLATLNGVSPTTLPRIADSFVVGSDTWIVRAYGKSGEIGTAIEATVVLTNGKLQIQKWDRLNTIGIPAWWNWEEEPTSTTAVGTGQ